ncbi:STAS domain-containing protein [Parendozoicomonas sp. Alg238-R29]|uniref:STAS domain-containing protein n=1 Tax=Parendozoicomonas sp. Alg238-R29 TaxID=2993446 RepID=UPI00248DDFC5|nr:STAS domain-containing protein [Parendozoicomonas sp. Alg238-R29]
MSELSVVSPGRFSLIGEINKESVPGLVDRGWAALADHDGKDLLVDLSGVNHADSAALAMLLSWVRRSRNDGKDLSYYQFPEDLMALARVCGVDTLLPLAEPV